MSGSAAVDAQLLAEDVVLREQIVLDRREVQKFVGVQANLDHVRDHLQCPAEVAYCLNFS